MELDNLGLSDVSLSDGERAEFSLNHSSESNHSQNVLLLTDRRLIHVQGTDRNRTAIFASIQDIDTAEITFQREGNGPYIWAGLAFVVSILLWRVISNPVGSVLAALLVAAMGVYLIADHIMTPGTRVLVVRTGTTEIRYDVEAEEDALEVFEFVNHLFRLKSNGSSNGNSSHPSTFAPR